MQYNKNQNNLLKLLLISSMIFFSNGLIANEKPFFDDQKRGWFWGEKPKKHIKKEEAKKKEPVKDGVIVFNGKEYQAIEKETSIPWEIIDLLHTKEIAKLEEETKSISVMFPTEKNVMEYKRLQKYIFTKAGDFTDTGHFLNKQNSEQAKWVYDTNMNSRLVVDAKRIDKREKQVEALKIHKNNITILVATLPTCNFCKQQMPLLNQFKAEYGIEYEEIDISKDLEFALSFKVERTPDLFLIYKEKNISEPLFTRFGNGLHTIEDLKQGVLASLFTFKKIDKELLEY